MIEIVALVACAVLAGVLLFGVAVWIYASIKPPSVSSRLQDELWQYDLWRFHD